MRRNHWFGLALVLLILGAAPSGVEARGAVTVTFTTTPAPQSQYTPNNVLAVWIEGPGGVFIKTIDRWSLVRTQHLVAWRAKAGVNDMDAVSGATRLNHAQPVSVTWNLTDRQNAIVADGTYTIRMEVAEANTAAGNLAQNNQGTFTFVKGPTAQVQNALANGGFTNVTINYDPTAPACGDGIVDAPETCDPMLADSCPGTCVAVDACMPAMKVGSSTMCTAACVAQAPITTCINNDGCCPVGCEGMDADCDGGGGGGGGGGNNSNEITGGCSTGGGAGLVFFAIPLLFGLSRRRR